MTYFVEVNKDFFLLDDKQKEKTKGLKKTKRQKGKTWEMGENVRYEFSSSALQLLRTCLHSPVHPLLHDKKGTNQTIRFLICFWTEKKFQNLLSVVYYKLIGPNKAGSRFGMSLLYGGSFAIWKMKLDREGRIENCQG